MTSFYVGPNRPALNLVTWDDVVSAAESGNLRETQWCELKKDVPGGASAANDELAKDLASLTVDGGVLIVGVRDGARTEADVVGLALEQIKSVSSRISQTASGPRISPAMHVVLHTITHPVDPDLGLLVVEVPASPTAPHMVEFQYWGRSADGKRRLSDVEVRALAETRAQTSAQFLDELTKMGDDVDWLPAPQRTQGRLYLLAKPVAGSPGAELGDQLANSHMLEIILPTFNVHRPTWATPFLSMNWPQALPTGVAAASWDSSNWDSEHEDDLAFLQIHDDGTIKYASGDAVQPWGDGQDCISFGGICEAVQQVGLLAAELANSYLHYGGSWHLGLRITGLQGLLPSLAYHPARSGHHWRRYTADVYTKDAVVTLDQLASTSSTVVESVARHLARAVGGLDRLLFPYNHPRELEQKHR